MAVFQNTLAMRLRTAYLAMHRRFNARFAEFGATADQFVLLSLLAENDGITQAQLGRLSASDPNTITAMLRVLSRRGLIRRQSHASDGRARCVHLTETGKKLHRQLVTATRSLHKRLEAIVPARQRISLANTLSRIALDESAER